MFFPYLKIEIPRSNLPEDRTETNRKKVAPAPKRRGCYPVIRTLLLCRAERANHRVCSADARREFASNSGRDVAAVVRILVIQLRFPRTRGCALAGADGPDCLVAVRSSGRRELGGAGVPHCLLQLDTPAWIGAPIVQPEIVDDAGKGGSSGLEVSRQHGIRRKVSSIVASRA